MGILRAFCADQRQRASGGLHPVRCVDVVFEQNRDAVERPSRATLRTFAVERIGDFKRVGVHLDHRAQHRAVLVQRLDSLDIGLDKLPRRALPRFHRCLEATQ